MKLSPAFLVFVLVIVLGFCTAIELNFVDDDSRKLLISPLETDSSISNWEEDHCVVVPEPELAEPVLLLYLPGKDQTPNEQEAFYKSATEMGILSVGLSYANDIDLQKICKNDFNCTVEALDMMVSGLNVSTPVMAEGVSRQDTIEYRLVKLLDYLADSSNSSMYQWQDFYSITDPEAFEYELKWSRIIVAGGEEGGVYALKMAKDNTVRKLALFSSPIVSHSDDEKVLEYLRTDPQTSEEFIYAFSSLRSRECNRMLKAWDTQLELSKYGEPALISNDYEGDDFGFSHQLVAKTDSCGDLSVIAQNEEYDNVWRYMINPSICDEPCGTTDNSTFACIFNGTCLEYEPLSASVKCDSCSNIGVIILVVVFCLVALLILGVASGAAVWYWKYKTGPRSEHYEQMQASE